MLSKYYNKTGRAQYPNIKIKAFGAQAKQTYGTHPSQIQNSSIFPLIRPRLPLDTNTLENNYLTVNNLMKDLISSITMLSKVFDLLELA